MCVCVCTLGVGKRGRYAEVLETMVLFACSLSRDIIELLSQCWPLRYPSLIFCLNNKLFTDLESLGSYYVQRLAKGQQMITWAQVQLYFSKHSELLLVISVFTSWGLNKSSSDSPCNHIAHSWARTKVPWNIEADLNNFNVYCPPWAINSRDFWIYCYKENKWSSV